LSCTEWREKEPRYHLKYAESRDGIHWDLNGKVAVDYANDNEAGIASATVIKKDKDYHMWYSYRFFGDYRNESKFAYRIGYARSENGIDWQRQDDGSETLSVSSDQDDWDSQMVAYPFVIETKMGDYLFYNGNGFGKSGIGFAKFY
jgi:hypothetical protein